MPVEEPLYPVNLRLKGRSVLVVGGGTVAASKVRGLLEGGADRILVVAPEVTPELVALADDPASGVRVEVRGYRSPEAADHWLVLTATDDGGVNRQVHGDGEAAGVWVNAADDPDNCTFTLPSRVRQGRLLVTFATGGHSPAMAAWLRRRFEAEFGPEYDVALELLSAEREAIKASGRSTEASNWLAALDAGFVDLLRAGQTEQARELLLSCLSSPSE